MRVIVDRGFRGFVALMCLLLLTQCATQSSGSREQALKRLGYSALPLQKIPGDDRYSGVFEVNGKPLRFLIDSGANSTDIESNLAKAVGLVEDRSVRVISRGALGREMVSGRATGSLKMGPMVAESFTYTVAMNRGQKTSTSSYAGQLGLDALSAAGALVDIPTGKMWLPGVNRGGSNAGVRALGPRPELGERILPMTMAGRLPHLLLYGNLNGRPVTWVVDTGAEVSVMAAEYFDQLGLPSVATNSRMIDASGDRIPLRRARLYNMTFQGVNVAVFDVAVAPLAEVRKHFKDSRGRPVDGILGMDFLTNGLALLDSGSRLLYLGKPR